jgi:DNA mismatch repair ATPase MutL
VRDNGRGIPRAEVALAVAPYYTSKIEDFAALETLESYGFR